MVGLVESLPSFGHPLPERTLRVTEPIGRVRVVERGRHLIIGQRKKREGLDFLVYLGKCLEHTGAPDRFDFNVWLDTSFPHAVFVSGTRGSGKSFDIGVLVEALLLPATAQISTLPRTPAVLILDPQNQFWTLGRSPDPNLEEDREQIATLKAWGLAPAAIPNIDVYVCPGDPKPIGVERDLVIATHDLTADDLCSFWETDVYAPQGHLIAVLIEKVAKTGYDTIAPTGSGTPHSPHVDPVPDYGIDNLLACLDRDSEILVNIAPNVIDAVRWRLQSLQATGIFGTTGVSVSDLAKEGRATVVMLRSVDDATKALVGGLLLKKVYETMGALHALEKVQRRTGRLEHAEPSYPRRVWCVVDEAHLFCPNEGRTASTRAMIEYVKRGRDAGLSLLLATQQPSAVNSNLLSQIDLALVHRLTFEGDIAAALARIPATVPSTYSASHSDVDARTVVRRFESGEALVGDGQVDRAFVCMVRPRLTAHGGAEPRA